MCMEEGLVDIWGTRTGPWAMGGASCTGDLLGEARKELRAKLEPQASVGK